LCKYKASITFRGKDWVKKKKQIIPLGKGKEFLTKAVTCTSRPFRANASCKHAATSLPT